MKIFSLLFALFTIGFVPASAQILFESLKNVPATMLNLKYAKSPPISGVYISGDFTDHKAGSSNCAPVVNDDYFNAGLQGFNDTIRGNVYGGALPVSSAGETVYQLRSLSMEPAVLGGIDYDVNNHLLTEMNFTIFSGETIYTSGACISLDLTGNIKWNKDGTFEYVRLSKCISRISFQYQLTDPTGLKSDTATVVVDFLPAEGLTVSLSGFSAQRNEGIVHLDWEISTRNRTKGFYIQRKTGDRWTNRGFVSIEESACTSPAKYSFADINALAVAAEYRLIIVDLDGFVYLSDVRVIESTPDLDIRIYPNPSSNGNVVIGLPISGAYSIEVITASGDTYAHYQPGHNRIYVIRDLKAGVYMIVITDKAGGRTAFKKIVVL